LTPYPLNLVNAASATSGNIQPMNNPGKTFSIHDARPAAGCGNCHRDADGAPVCRSISAAPCPAPALSGPTDQLARVLAALSQGLGCAADGAGLVRSLSVQPGEVDLELAVPPHCGGIALADTAFQTLRGLLPDTDIYVRPSA